MPKPVKPQLRIPRRVIDGVLLLDKPVGLSSNAALQRAKRLYRAAKAGHTGTLDPLASGLLPLCFGEATKFAQQLLDAPKRYTATVRFGATTATGDTEGEVLATHPVAFSREALEAALTTFVGRIAQVPPAFSALKFQGRAYYEYARAGQEIPRVPRDVDIHSLRLTAWNTPDAGLDIECSKGTYIRVLAEDLGGALGGGAHLASLRRTATGGFDLAEAVTLDRLEDMTEDERLAALRPAAVLVADLPALGVSEAEAARFRQGQALPAPGRPEGICAVYGAGVFLGVATVADGVARPRRVVVEHPDAMPADT
ncbi:MAG: tRNA pseudouridine(55) synthase TruB [Betaproteobacteria bacterium]